MIVSKKLCPLFFMISIVLFIQSGYSLDQIHFVLHESDQICFPLKNIIPDQKIIQNLEIEDGSIIDFWLPQKYTHFKLEKFLPISINPQTIVDITTFGKRVGVLAQTNEATVCVLIDINPHSSKSESLIINIAPLTEKCTKVFFDETSIYTACWFTFEQEVNFCTTNYKNDQIFTCKPYEFKNDQTEKTTNIKLTPKLEYFNGGGFNKLFVLFVQSEFQSESNIFNKFYLIGLERYGLMELLPDEVIIRVHIISYDHNLKTTVLLILVQEKTGKKSLRFYKFIDFSFVAIEENTLFEEIQIETTDFYVTTDSLFLINPSEKKGIEIIEMNFQKMIFPTIFLPNQLSFRRLISDGDLLLFETINNNDEIQWHGFEKETHRLFVYDLAKNGLNADFVVAVKIDSISYVVLLSDLNADVYKFHNLKNVCGKFNNSPNKVEEIAFKIDNKIVFKAKIEKQPFSFIRSNEIISKKIEISSNFINSDQQIFLDFEGNDLQFLINDPINYFSLVQEEKSIISSDFDCTPIYIIIDKNKKITFCQESKIIINSDFINFHISNKFTFEKRISIDVEQIDMSKILMAQFIFSEYALVVDKSNIIWFLNINLKKQNIELFQNDILQQFDECISKKSGFLCRKDDDLTIVEIQKDNHSLKFTSRFFSSKPKMIFQTLIFSTFENEKFFYLRESFNIKDKFNILSDKNQKEVKIITSGLILTHETKILEIGRNELIIINESKNDFQIIGIFDNSIIHFPFFQTQKFKKIIQVINLELFHIFAFVYETIDGKLRLYVAKSSILVYNRLIRDIELSIKGENIRLSANNLTEDLIMFIIYSKGEKNISQSFLFYLNGPIYNVKSDQISDRITFSLNNDRYLYKTIFSSNNENFKTKTSLLTIPDFKSDTQIIDLETNGSIQIYQGLSDAKIINPIGKGLTFIGRIFPIEKSEIMHSSKGLSSEKKLVLTVENNNFRLTNGYHFITKIERMRNKNLRKCHLIKTHFQSKNNKPYFICQNSITFQNIISDMHEFTIFLLKKEIDVLSVQMIFKEESLFLCAIDLNRSNIHFYKFIQENKQFVLEKHIEFTINDFHFYTRQIDSVFMFENEFDKSIFFLIHEKLSDKIILKVLKLSENFFQKQIENEINVFDENEKKQRIYDFNCGLNEKVTFCFFRTNNKILEAQLEKKTENKFIFKTINVYDFDGLSQIVKSCKILFNRNFIGVLFDDSVKNGLKIYNRHSNGRLFAELISDSFDLMTNFELYEDFKSKTTFLFVSVFQNRLQDSILFNSLVVKKYSLQNISLKIEKNALDYYGKINFMLVDSFGGHHSTSISYVLQQNVAKYLLTIVLMILVLTLIVLASWIFVSVKQNEKIKKGLRQFQQNNTLFMDQTSMQI